MRELILHALEDGLDRPNQPKLITIIGDLDLEELTDFVVNRLKEHGYE